MLRSLKNWLANPQFSKKCGYASCAVKQKAFQLKVECLDDRILPSFSPISPNAGYPFSAVVQVQITYADGEMAMGSGAMIDSFHVLTAGHVLYDSDKGGWAKSVEVIPDRYNNSAPFGTANMTYERVDSSWITWNKSHPEQPSTTAEDVGLITLDRKIGNSTGWLGFGWNSDNSFFTNHYFETAGYPGTIGNGEQMYNGFGKLTGVKGTDLLSTEGNITVVPGQSGSPLFSNANRVIYGVVSGVSGSESNANTTDYFARITQPVYNWIKNALNSDRAPASTSTAAIVASAVQNVAHSLQNAFGGFRLDSFEVDPSADGTVAALASDSSIQPTTRNAEALAKPNAALQDSQSMFLANLDQDQILATDHSQASTTADPATTIALVGLGDTVAANLPGLAGLRSDGDVFLASLD